VLPRENDKVVEFDGGVVTAAIRRVALLADERSQAYLSGQSLWRNPRLQWRNVIWDLNTIVITQSVFEGKATPPKTKKGYRKMILTPKQMAELKEYKDKNHSHAGPDAWVFPGKRNRPLDMGWLMSQHVKPLAEELGMQRIHWQALRHLNNSLMMNEGVDVATRMDRLGHVTDRVDLIYSHSGDEAQSGGHRRRLREDWKRPGTYSRRSGRRAFTPGLRS